MIRVENNGSNVVLNRVQVLISEEGVIYIEHPKSSDVDYFKFQIKDMTADRFQKMVTELEKWDSEYEDEDDEEDFEDLEG